jgi:hypothetical protein
MKILCIILLFIIALPMNIFSMEFQPTDRTPEFEIGSPLLGNLPY